MKFDLKYVDSDSSEKTNNYAPKVNEALENEVMSLEAFIAKVNEEIRTKAR